MTFSCLNGFVEFFVNPADHKVQLKQFVISLEFHGQITSCGADVVISPICYWSSTAHVAQSSDFIVTFEVTEVAEELRLQHCLLLCRKDGFKSEALDLL